MKRAPGTMIGNRAIATEQKPEIAAEFPHELTPNRPEPNRLEERAKQAPRGRRVRGERPTEIP